MVMFLAQGDSKVNTISISGLGCVGILINFLNEKCNLLRLLSSLRFVCHGIACTLPHRSTETCLCMCVNQDLMLFCDGCDKGYHMNCHIPQITDKPSGGMSILCTITFPFCKIRVLVAIVVCFLSNQTVGLPVLHRLGISLCGRLLVMWHCEIIMWLR